MNDTHVPKGSFDLRAYCRRIGFQGSGRVGVDTLNAIVWHHATTIPFENLDPLLRRAVHLDVDSLVQKMVHSRRGGYCFEQNQLLQAALEELGFQVRPLAARVLWNRPPDAMTARSHMLLHVAVAGDPYVVDVGFGGLTLTGALRLVEGVTQSTPHEPFRVVRAGEDWLLQAQVKEEWKTLYRFDLQRQYRVDYEVSNWYLSNHPDSHFIHGLSVALPGRGCRYALRGSELAIHRSGGETERRSLATPQQVHQTLAEVFGIELPLDAELSEALARVLVQ